MKKILQLSEFNIFRFLQKAVGTSAYIEMQWQENVRTVEGKIL